MKTASTAYGAIAESNSARYYAKYIVDGKERKDELNDFKLKAQINPNNNIGIGNTCSSSVSFSVYKPGVSLENKEITLFQGIRVNNTIEHVKLGIFKITKQESDGEYTKYEGYDRMYSLMEMGYFSDIAFPSTDEAILKDICSQTGIAFASSITSHIIEEKPEGYTRREMIGYMAALQGKNALINADGNLELRWYSDTGYELDNNRYYQDGITFTTSKDFTLQLLTCNNGSKGEKSTISSGAGAAGITFTNPFMTQDVLDDVYKKIGGFTYRPITVKFIGDFRIEPGDIVTVQKDGANYKVPVMQITHECDGGLISTIKSIGQSDTLSSNASSGPVAKAMERYYGELVLINNALINKLDAETANITYASIKQLNTVKANIDDLKANTLTAQTADLKYATINSLDAAAARITVLEAGSADIGDLRSQVADISTLMFGVASGGSLTTEFSNTVVGLIGDAQIKSAMIKDVAADKITSGKIYTNLVEVCSQSGNLDIKDNTILIKDASTAPRIQVGKDAAGDYNMYVWDKSGQLMFDALGLTEDGIKRPVIRNDMVSNNANISAKKLDITSLFTEINGSAETIKSSRIYVDADKQTLDVAFKTVKTGMDEAGAAAGQAIAGVQLLTETITTQGTQLTAIQGQISSKVWQQDITTAVTPLKNTTTTLTNQYTSLNQALTGLTATVNSNKTSIDKKADGSTVTSLQNTLTNLQADLSGFKSTVNNTYTTKTEFSGLQIGGRNILTGTKNFDADCTMNTASSITEDKYNGLSVLCAQVPDTPYRDTCRWKSVTVQPDTFYTLSFYGKAEIDGVQITSHLHPNAVVSGYNKHGNTTHSADGTIKTILTENWERYWIVWKTRSDIAEAKTLTPARLMKDINSAFVGKKVYICGFKMEKGNKATDWTSAPEDTDAQIEEIDSKFGDYATTAALNSAIEQTDRSITQFVSATYATKSSLTNYATTQSVNASLELKIGKTDTEQIISMINASADEINLTSNRLTISSDYYKMDRYGNTEFVAYDNNFANTKYNIDIGDGYTYMMNLNGISIDFYTNGVQCGYLHNTKNPYNPDGGLQISCNYISFQRGGGIGQLWFGQDYITMHVADGWTEKTINFGVTFKTAPHVFLQQTGGASSENMRVVNVTKTYFTVGLFSSSGSGFVNTFDWLAIG